MNRTAVSLMLAVSLIPCGAFADSTLESVAEISKNAAVSADLTEAAGLASRPLDGAALKNAAPAVALALAPDKNEPLKLSAARQHEVRPIPALSAVKDPAPAQRAGHRSFRERLADGFQAAAMLPAGTLLMVSEAVGIPVLGDIIAAAAAIASIALTPVAFIANFF
ncbi:MAG: hypothetical protein WCW52_01065 [Elusimicrobiales bacterium]|jgi:hypothetical protein